MQKKLQHVFFYGKVSSLSRCELKSFLISHLCKLEKISIATYDWFHVFFNHSIRVLPFNVYQCYATKPLLVPWYSIRTFLRLNPLNNLPAEDDVVGMIAKMPVTFVNLGTISHGFHQNCHMMSSKIGHGLLAEWSTGPDPQENPLDPSEFLE